MNNYEQLQKLNKSIEEIRHNLFLRIEEVQESYAQKGWLPRRINLNKGVIRGLIELYAWGQWQIYALLDKLLTQSVPLSATDEYLDVHCEQVGIVRRKSLKARGYVFFAQSENDKSNISIPKGRIVRTKANLQGIVYRYVTLEDAVANGGGVLVPVESEEYGTGANAVAYEICELVTSVQGIVQVYNKPDWLTFEGTETEDDTALRARYRLAWLGLNGCTKYAYQAWALSVQGVESVSVLDQHPRGQGTVDIVVRGSAHIPTASLLKRVGEVIQEKAPINDDWLVKAPQAFPLTLSLTLEYIYSEAELIEKEARAKFQSIFKKESEFLNIKKLEIGADLTLSQVHAIGMSIEGVKKVYIHSPIEDVLVPADGMAVLEALNITLKRAEEL